MSDEFMIIDRDPNELARMLERVGEEEFIRVIIVGHRKFRAPDCGCDICRGKFEEDDELRKAAE